MTKYVLDQYAGPELDYSTLGFRANVGDILDATGAPDARWSVNANQGAAETVDRYTIGGFDPSFVEPTDGHFLVYDANLNTYVPAAPVAALTPVADTVNEGLINDPASLTAVALSDTIGSAVDVEEVRALAAESDLQTQVNNWSTFGVLKGDWTATTYIAGDIVNHSASIWGATTAATAGDVPGVAALWQEMPATVDAQARSDIGVATTIVRTDDPGILRDATMDREADWATADRDTNQRVYQALGYDGRRIFPGGVEIGDGGTHLREVANTDLSWVAFRDAAGLVPELRLDLAGHVPQEVVDAWGARGGWSTAALPIDVLIVAGQSNATKRSTLPATVSELDARVLEWDPVGLAMAPVPASDVQWIGNEFAREYVKSVTGRRVLIVPCAMGSTGFVETSNEGQTWSWDRTNVTADVNLYDRMIARADAALAASGDGARFIGVLWSQGESDRNVLTEAQYATKLDDLIATARTDLAVSDLPFVIGSMVPETIEADTAGTAAINLALLDTPRRVARTAYVWGPKDHPEHGGGLIHWSPQGQAIRAREMAADGLYRARLNLATGKPVPPQRLRVTRSGTEAIIAWDAPPSRVTAYTIEQSTDSGGVWTPVTLAGPIITTATVTVATNLPLWVRGSTTNEVGTSDLTTEVHA